MPCRLKTIVRPNIAGLDSKECGENRSNPAAKKSEGARKVRAVGGASRRSLSNDGGQLKNVHYICVLGFVVLMLKASTWQTTKLCPNL